MTSVGCVDVSDLIYTNHEGDSMTENLPLQGIAQLRPDFVVPGLLSNEM
jgi:hypothetical protein